MFMRHRTFHDCLVVSAEGARLYQPGATPQDEEVAIRKGLKARFILAYGAGFQPSLTWGSPRILGRCPRLVWAGPSALGDTNLRPAMWGMDLSFPAVPSPRCQMPHLCTMLCGRTSLIFVPFVTVPLRLFAHNERVRCYCWAGCRKPFPVHSDSAIESGGLR